MNVITFTYSYSFSASAPFIQSGLWDYFDVHLFFYYVIFFFIAFVHTKLLKKYYIKHFFLSPSKIAVSFNTSATVYVAICFLLVNEGKEQNRESSL